MRPPRSEQLSVVNLSARHASLSPVSSKWNMTIQKKLPWQETSNYTEKGMNPYIDGAKNFGQGAIDRKRDETKELHKIQEAIRLKKCSNLMRERSAAHIQSKKSNVTHQLLPGFQKDFITRNKYSLHYLQKVKPKESGQFYVATSKSNPEMYSV